MPAQYSHTADATIQKTPRAVMGLLTPKEAATLLKVSVSFLAKARMRGDGPAYSQIGRSIRYQTDDLDKWVKGHKRLSTSER
jgi:excisionase family DNA binding protein